MLASLWVHLFPSSNMSVWASFAVNRVEKKVM